MFNSNFAYKLDDKNKLVFYKVHMTVCKLNVAKSDKQR